jgi:Ca2+-binding RTX toxin-like protein
LAANIERMNLIGSGAINGTGNSSNNSITGNGAGNTLNGKGGNDTLNGSLGNDRLVGGMGEDTFRFNTTLNASTNVDRIVDFSVADDRIELENAIFAGLSTGGLGAGRFFIGSAAHDANDRIIYNSHSGMLMYDADGKGGVAAVKFATLDTGLALTHMDFFVI